MIWLAIGAGVLASAVGGLFWYSRAAARRAEAAVPVDGEFVEIDGNRLHYVDRGSGPTLVLIHGLGGQLRHFAPALVDDLVRDFRVILIDRPGSGYSVRAPGAGAGLSQQAETIARFMRSLGLGKVMLVGHSLGGALSLAIAAEHPDCVGALALIAPLSQDQKDVPDVFKGLEIRSGLARRVIAHTIAVPMALATWDKALTVIFGPEKVPEDFGTRGGGLLAARPCNIFETSSDLVALENRLPELVAHYGSIRIPVAILYGDSDQLLDPRRHGETTAAQIAGSRLDIVPGGHMLPFTQPEMTADWVRSVAASSGDGAKQEAA